MTQTGLYGPGNHPYEVKYQNTTKRLYAYYNYFVKVCKVKKQENILIECAKLLFESTVFTCLYTYVLENQILNFCLYQEDCWFNLTKCQILLRFIYGTDASCGWVAFKSIL